MTLRVHAQMESSQVNGPGRRAVIWVQGCSLGCTGCFNKRSHSTAGGHEVKCDLNHKVAAGAALCFPALNPEGASWSDLS